MILRYQLSVWCTNKSILFRNLIRIFEYIIYSWLLILLHFSRITWVVVQAEILHQWTLGVRYIYFNNNAFLLVLSLTRSFQYFCRIQHSSWAYGAFWTIVSTGVILKPSDQSGSLTQMESFLRMNGWFSLVLGNECASEKFWQEVYCFLHFVLSCRNSSLLFLKETHVPQQRLFQVSQQHLHLSEWRWQNGSLSHFTTLIAKAGSAWFIQWYTYSYCGKCMCYRASSEKRQKDYGCWRK